MTAKRRLNALSFVALRLPARQLIAEMYALLFRLAFEAKSQDVRFRAAAHLLID